MRRLKQKGNLFTAIVVLITLPFIMNSNNGSNPLAAPLAIVFKLFFICVIAYFLYWLLIRNKQKQATLKANNIAWRKPPTTNKTTHHAAPTTEREESIIQKSDGTPPQLNQEKPEVWSKALINALEWKKFEDLCAAYFNEKGYKANLTPPGADGGIDIYLFKESYSLSKAFGIIQCKAWNGHRVGVKPVRELYGVMASEKTPGV